MTTRLRKTTPQITLCTHFLLDIVESFPDRGNAGNEKQEEGIHRHHPPGIRKVDRVARVDKRGTDIFPEIFPLRGGIGKNGKVNQRIEHQKHREQFIETGDTSQPAEKNKYQSQNHWPRL